MQVLIALMVVLSMAALGTVLMWQGWQVARSALLDSAGESARAMAKLINEKSRRIIGPAGATLRYLAFDPVSEADALPERLSRLDVFTTALESIPYVSAAYAGYPNGEFFLVRTLQGERAQELFDPPADAAFLVQTITLDDKGALVGEWRFYDRRLRLLSAQVHPNYHYDPRTRSWYRGALAQNEEYLTDPYVFFTTAQAGVTLSRRAEDGGAVLGLDVALSDLGSELKDLRPTPHTEIAIVDGQGAVVAYSDLAQTLVRQGDQLSFKPLPDLHVGALTALAADTATDHTGTYDVDGAFWFGITMALDALPGRNLRLLIATPDSDLLATVRDGLRHQLWWTLGLIAVLLAVGWLLGRRLGLSLARLAQQAQQVTRFDFRQPQPANSIVREILALEIVLSDVCFTIENFLAISETISGETKREHMVQSVLDRTVATMGCDFGAVYFYHDDTQSLQLSTVAGRCHVREPEPPALDAGKSWAGKPWADKSWAGTGVPEELPLASLEPGNTAIGTMVPGTGQVALPLRDRQQRPLGLLLLNHPVDESHGSDDFLAFAEKLSGTLAVAIETRQLIEAQRTLLDAVIRVMADAIDAKSPYTGAHCERVPQLATMIVDRMTEETGGPYAGFRLNEDERYAFHLGAWLHDCGKVTSPEHIIDKATKLETIYNRIHEVRTRFEVLWRDAEIAHLQRLRAGADADASLGEMRARQKALEDDFAFIARCNEGGEFMTDEAIARVREIAGQTWTRHFDNRLGLSREESRRLGPPALPGAPDGLPDQGVQESGVQEFLLADRPEQVVPWGARRPPVEKGDPANIYGFDMKLPAQQLDLGEIHNLSIRRGTLTEEERFKINDHIVQTYIMLRSLPWPAHLRNVPEIAVNHHERMDGKGYPRHLDAGQLNVVDRVMALADVFEALTASDRPYKPPRTLTDSLRLMASMCREGHLDPEVFRYFLHSRLWEVYGDRFLHPDQRGTVDVAAIEQALDAA